jgi:hypothetical protein
LVFTNTIVLTEIVPLAKLNQAETVFVVAFILLCLRCQPVLCHAK